MLGTLLNHTDEASRAQWSQSLTPAEIEALLSAIDAEMGPERTQRFKEKHPRAVLRGQEAVDWDFLVAVTRSRH